MARHGMLNRGRRANKTGDWFRLGIVSATMLAPLIARWNDLRLSERTSKLSKEWGGRADAQTRDLRRVGAERARALSELAAERSQRWADLARARSDEWRELAAGRAGEWGAVAADHARELGEQAMALSDDLLALAAERAGELRKQAANRLEDARQQFLATKAYDTLKETIPAVAKLDNRRSRRTATTLWVVGVVIGLAAAAAGYIIVRARLRAAAQEPLVELPQNGASGPANPTTTHGPAATIAGALSGLRAAAERRGIHTMSDSDMASDANAAPLIGNIHTMVYHDATDDNLPSEENRIYFSNEAEARARGYRPAHPSAIEHNQSPTS